MKPYNNKLLSIILLCLIGIYVFAKIFRAPGRESNMQSALFHIDTAAVTEIDMYPQKGGRSEIKLVRQDGKWYLEYGSHRAEPMAPLVQSALGSLANVTVQRVVAKRPGQWDEYKVGDTSGTHVIAYSGKEPLAACWLGQGTSPEGGYYGATVSYIRMQGHDEVYAVDGYMDQLFDKSSADWRDKSFLHLDKSAVSRVSFIGAGGFTLDKKDTTWIMGSGKASTDSINRYLNGLQAKDLAIFADDFQPSRDADETIVFGKSNIPAATIKAWRQSDGNWVLNSSQRPAIYFQLDDAAFRKTFWWEPKRFTPRH